MGRFEREILPKALIDAQAKRESLEREKMGISMKLGMDEEFRDHNCDCDRCESRDYEPLSAFEREELEADFDELDVGISNLERDIKTMTNYKTFVESKGLV